MKKEILEHHKNYLERKELYKKYGVNIDKERKFILDKADPVFGDILEIGTGKGHFAVLLAQEGYKFTSIDIAEETQGLAKMSLKYFGLDKFATFKIENAENMSFEDGSFDIIFSVNTVHHLDNPHKVMEEISRILTFEGKIVISDFSEEGFKILDKVHASEGRTHQKAKHDLKDMDLYLKQKKFKTEYHEDKFQHMLIAYRPIA